jgi:hypothetical protein
LAEGVSRISGRRQCRRGLLLLAFGRSSTISAPAFPAIAAAMRWPTASVACRIGSAARAIPRRLRGLGIDDIAEDVFASRPQFVDEFEAIFSVE